MDINNGTDFGTIKILTLKGEKGDQGEAGVSGDYSGLTNKPSINNVTLSGNKSGSDLGLATETAVQQAQSDASDALSQIGTGSLDTTSQTIIPAINEVAHFQSWCSIVGAEKSISSTPSKFNLTVYKGGYDQFFDTSVENQVTIKKSATFFITINQSVTASSASEILKRGSLYKNGLSLAGSSFSFTFGSVGNSSIYPLVAGDILTLYGSTSSGTATESVWVELVPICY